MAFSPRLAEGRARLHVVANGQTSRPPEVVSDEELIRAFEKGDRELAGRLYDRLIGVVEAALFRVFGRRETDHDDLVQAAFEQIMLTLMRRRFSQACSLASWASSVTTHLALNALRSRCRERRVIDRNQELPSTARNRHLDTDVERVSCAREALAKLRYYLTCLKPEKAETLVLHDVMGHELSEVATLMGISLPAAQSRLQRARRELYRLVEEGGAHPGEVL